MKILFPGLGALLVLVSVAVAANLSRQVIEAGKKKVAVCPDFQSHLFCEAETFDTPGICGHGFDCVLMKAGDREVRCGVEYYCQSAPPKASPTSH